MRLRRLLMAAFLAAAVLPAIGFILWVDVAALEREKAGVHDKHHAIARHLAKMAELVTQDRLSLLKSYVWAADSRGVGIGFLDSAARRQIRQFVLVDAWSGDILRENVLDDRRSMTHDLVTRLTADAGAETRVWPGMLDAAGRPTLFMAYRPSPDRIVLAAVDPSFLADLTRSITFGERGHAVIVDGTGQALAHPRQDWLDEMRNLAGVKPVAAMLAGDDGVIEFHSPALNKDMIAGYTVSPEMRWGVMVVQPVQELQASAWSLFLTAATVLFPLTLLFAVVAGGLTARMVARPIERVADAAKRFAAGDHDARAPEPKGVAVTETAALARRFNAMAEAARAQEESLRMSLDRAQVADRAKSVFLANMSHELRTPLNAVIGFSDVMANELLGPVENPKYLEYSRDISSSAQHLLALINDVLDLSRVESNHLQLESAKLKLGDLVRLAGRQIGPQASEHGLRLVVDAPAASLTMVADERRVLQILLNLLSNAVRFTPRGGEVRLSGSVEDDRVRFVVADTGIGMTEEQQDLALQPFGQPLQPLDPADRGCGLGLPLAQHLARLHGGDITIDSAPGRGCRVTVDLPVRRAPVVAAAAA